MTLILAMFLSLTATQDKPTWTDICTDPEARVAYCDNVGKDAYNATGTRVMRNVKLGKIIGVTWRPKGSIISLPGFPVRTSPRDAYYYIIDDGGDRPFIRQCREIRAR